MHDLPLTEKSTAASRAGPGTAGIFSDPERNYASGATIRARSILSRFSATFSTSKYRNAIQQGLQVQATRAARTADIGRRCYIFRRYW